YMYTALKGDNYRLGPIDEHGARTPTFDSMGRINRSFTLTLAPVLARLELQRVSHFGRAYGGVPPYDDTGVVTEVQSSVRVPLIISEYSDARGRTYVSVVNNSGGESTQLA